MILESHPMCLKHLRKFCMSESWITYLLRCADDTLYCGITNNLIRRVKQHNEGKGAKYTRGRGPVTVLKFWIYPTKGEALRFEAFVKKLSREEKLKLI